MKHFVIDTIEKMKKFRIIPKADRREKTVRFRKTKKALVAVVSLFILYLLIPLPSNPFADSQSIVILDRNNRILRVFLNEQEQWKIPSSPLKAIPSKLEKAVICFEDKHFYHHPGVNPVSIVRALMQNITAGKIKSGGSTITMQVARLIQPKKRTYFGKLLEAFQAVKLEIRYSKEEILRMYLDNAPYGRNVIGFRTASLRYFNKEPENLSWAEATALAVIPNEPSLIKTGVNSKPLLEKRNRLLKKLLEKNAINSETYKLACVEPLPGKTYTFPFLIPHLSEKLKADGILEIGLNKTTIDQFVQRTAEEITARRTGETARFGVYNASVLVVETATRKIRAYVGSQDFDDKKTCGEVDGVRAVNSTGSLLKPFLFAKCIDEGIIIPDSVLADIPTNFGSFAPENFTRQFSGLVSAHDALIRSLNVPAVDLLSLHGLKEFHLFLENAGLAYLSQSPDYYGLAMIIGGVEASLWEMAMLYTGLGNMGEFKPLTILENSKDESPREKQLISPAAAFMILETLKDLKRPGLILNWRSTQKIKLVAWKTGTSYGQRDGWAVGVTPKWTVAVWTGNFNNRSNGLLTGESCAGPILFEILDRLTVGQRETWFKKPYGQFKTIEICAATGYRAGENCKDRVTMEVPRNMKPLTSCPYHKALFVTNDEKKEVCSLCWEPGNHKKIVRLVYPPDITQFLRENGMAVYDIPRHKKDCPGTQGDTPLQILYPQQNARIIIPREMNGVQQKVLFKIAHTEKKSKIFWYLDNRYLGMTLDDTIKIATPESGRHALTVVDEDGNRSKVYFTVSRNI